MKLHSQHPILPPGHIPFPLFWAGLSLLYALLFIGPDFLQAPVSGLHGFINAMFQWCVVSACAAAFIGLISLSRWIFAITFPLLFCFSAALLYFKLFMGTGLTPMVIELALENDLKTWSTVMSPLFILAVILAILLSAAVVWLRFKVSRPRKPLLWLIPFIAVTLAPFFIQRIKAPVTARMPYVFYYSADEYLENRCTVNEDRSNFTNVPAQAADSEIDVLLVIGESLRPDHLSFNGYERQTTPLLAREPNLVTLPGMRTIPCFTHVSVPHILTRADSLNTDRAYTEQSLITLFKNAGFHTAWLANQDATRTYTYFMHEANTLIYANAAKTLYDYDVWLDRDMLEPFTSHCLSHGKNLTVFHTIGSHWWYKSHYSPESATFTPDIDSRILSDLTHEQIVNSYDNTIVETDRFLSELINLVRHRNAIMIFISDHGEALGEGGNYLHAADYPELHPTAAFVWYSDAYAEAHPDKVLNLRQNSSANMLTDVIFHSVLDGAAITTAPLQPRYSIFQSPQNRNE